MYGKEENSDGPDTILDKIEQEEKYQKDQHKNLEYKTFLKDSQRKKIECLIGQSEMRVVKLKEKLDTVDKKVLHEIKMKRLWK